MSWSLWFFMERTKPTCKTCHDDQAKGLKKHCSGIDWVKECPLNHVPKLAQGNIDFVALFLRIQPFLFDGMGGLNCAAIDFGFDKYDIPKGLHENYTDKCLICIKAIGIIQKNEKNHAEHKAKSNRK